MHYFSKSIAPLLGLFISLPILALIAYALYEKSFGLTTLSLSEFILYARQTATILVGSMLLIAILGTLSAYLSARFVYTGSSLFSLLFVLPLAYPAYIIGYTYVGFFEYRGILSTLLKNDSFRLDILNLYGAIAVLSFALFPYVYILARVSFASFSSSITELASLYGLSHTKAFIKLYLPLAYPAIFGGMLLSAMELLSDYGTVSYFGIDTFSVGIFKSWFGYGNLLDAITIALVLLLIVFALLLGEASARKKFRFASATHSSKKAPKIMLKGRANSIAFLLSLVISTISFFIPTLVLAYWLFLDRQTLDWSALGYLANTLIVSVSSSWMIVIVGFIMFYFMRFYPSRFASISHKLSMLGYAIPGAVVGIGMLIIAQFANTLSLTWLLGSFGILFFAYLCRYFSASLGSIENGFSKIDKSIDDTSLLFGKSTFYRLSKVYLPLMRPYLISGFLILYIDIAKELPATLLLRPFNYDTIAIRIYELASNEMLYKTALPSLLLVLTTSLAVIVLNYPLPFLQNRKKDAPLKGN